MHAFFRVFDPAFDALARGYGRLVRGLARAWVVVLVCYVAADRLRRLVRAAPADRLHPEPRPRHPDHLAAAAAGRRRWRAPMRWCSGRPTWCCPTPGVKYSNAFTGRNGATFTSATNAGLLFLVLDDFEERHQQGPDRRQDRPGGARQAGADRGGAVLRVHPAAGARHGRGGRLLHAPAGHAGHGPDRVRPHHAGVRRRGQPHARHRQRVHHLPGRHPAGLRRRRPRQGADAEGAGDQHLRGHARVHGLGLRQRLQHVRPHLSRHGAGRRRLPPRTRRACRRSACARPRGRWCRSAAS